MHYCGVVSSQHQDIDAISNVAVTLQHAPHIKFFMQYISDKSFVL